MGEGKLASKLEGGEELPKDDVTKTDEVTQAGPILEATPTTQPAGDPALVTLLQQMAKTQELLAAAVTNGNSNGVNELSQQIAKTFGEINLLNNNSSKVKFADPKEDDLLPNGEEVTYFTRGFGYCFTSYLNNGIRRYAPFRSILFVLNNAHKRQSGNEEAVVYVSSYTTNLKKEVEFIENSPFYGSTVFKHSMDQLMSMPSNAFAAKFSGIVSAVQAMTPDAVLGNARELGISTAASPLAELRQLVSAKLTEKVIIEEINQNKDRWEKAAESLAQK